MVVPHTITQRHNHTVTVDPMTILRYAMSMYAIVELGGRQWKVEPGTRLEINRLDGAVGSEHAVERVLLTHNGSTIQVGRPYVKGAKVIYEVLSHPRGPKVIAYKFRRRENWRKTVGHRQSLTTLIVKEISVQ